MSAAAPVSQAAFARALLDPAQPSPAGLCAWNAADPAKRFAVYRNNVVCSLIDSLADTFPVVSQLVGEAFFRAMARCFVDAHPPTSPALVRYGESFPAFVNAFQPAAELPYLAEVARLEYARLLAYHAADAQALNPEQIAAELADPEQAARTCFVLHPSLQSLRGEYAAVSLWAAHQGALAIESVQPFMAEHALVWRSGLDVELSVVSAASFSFIESLQSGQVLGIAAAQALAEAPDFDLGARLAHLIHAGLITGFYMPHEPESESL